MRQVSRAMIVSDAMITKFESLSPDSRVEDAVQCLIRTTQHEFPVVDGAGALRGVLTRDDMIRALQERGLDAPVLEVMRRDIPVAHHRQPLDEALRTMREGGHPAVGIVDGEGRLVGLITPENVGELMMVQAARPPRLPPVNPWGPGRVRGAPSA
jgi:stage IV sporulation protein FB